MKRLLCLLLTLIMCFSCLVACDFGGGSGDGNDDGTADDDGKKPDGNKPPVGGTPLEEDWWEELAYDETSLIFQMTHCSNNQELSSGCERYLAGESTDDGEIDRLVDLRNEDAYTNTMVNVTYRYYDDIAATYGFSQCIDLMYNEALISSTTSPDMYCNFMTDMLVASLKGAFANLYSTKHGEGDYKGENYFYTKDEAYMADLMGSLTLSMDKIYVIASDYFLDLIRAFFVVPVNVKLYNSIAGSMIGDLNGDTKKDIKDFYEEIYNMDWTYGRLAEYSAYIHKNGAAGVEGDSFDDILGFALGENGLPAAGLVYSSSVSIIKREWVANAQNYKCYYPKENAELYALADAVDNLFDQKGVLSVSKEMAGEVGESTQNLGVRNRFVADKVLFGGIILVGSIEYEEYQRMKGEDTGFGLVPVPLYRDNSDDKYLTQIHVIGRAGAIGRNTKKFVQCSAFLQYQTVNSTEILNQYYDYNLTYDAASGLDGNVDMLKYIRKNVRTSFDRLFEDTIGFMNKSTDTESVSNRWHTILCDHSYQVDLRDWYNSLVGGKDQYLNDLLKQYDSLPE